MPARNRPGQPNTQPTLPLEAREGEPVQGVYSIEHITFANAETGYAVVRLVPADEASGIPIPAVGHFGAPRVGACSRIEGTWRRDPKYGLQVRLAHAAPETPQSLAAIERYLAGRSVKGLGPHYAQALVAYFGADTFEMLQHGGRDFAKVPGIGPVRAQMIRGSWAEHEGIHELMVNLEGTAGLTPNQAQRIYRRYGLNAWQIVSQDPYVLAEEIRGIGFKTCDRIGRDLGIAHDAPQRLQAGIIHLLRRALSEGHLWSAPESIVAEAATLLQVPQETIQPQVDQIIDQKRVTCEELSTNETPATALYLPEIAHTERRIAERLASLLSAPPISSLRLSPSQAQRLVSRIGPSNLTGEQRDAVCNLLKGDRLVILTGGPGTGKTTTVRALIGCLETLRVSYALCATTGRASKQLAASTSRRAATVHRHLGIGLGPGKVEPVSESVLIIDESSMIDIWLLNEIVARLTPSTHLFLVGDVDQLPSVGPGAVLQDLIAATDQNHLPKTHVTRLKQIFRQEAGERSMIVVNCHRVREGERPIADVPKTSDYFEMYRDAPEEAAELAVSLTSARLPRFLGVLPSEIQVLAPMHGGKAGIRALNLALQRALNPAAPGKAEITVRGAGIDPEHGQLLREGDKVRQTRNDYKKRVFNGDLGRIVRIDSRDRVLRVHFDEHDVDYAFEELDAIVHAWAMTVHAAQGSQWPAVVIVFLKSHYVMLERNILYTALSRAQRLAVLVTQDQALRIAVSQDRSTRRRTSLAMRLQAVLTEQAHAPSA